MDHEIAAKETEEYMEKADVEQDVGADENDILPLPTFPAIDKVLSFMRARLEIPERPVVTEQHENIIATLPPPPPPPPTNNNEIIVELPSSTPVVIEFATVVTVKSGELTQQPIRSVSPPVEQPDDDDDDIHTRVDKVVKSSGRKKKHVLASMLARQYIRTLDTTT